jgi:hypothetical protein
MRGRVLRVVPVSLRPLLQMQSLFASLEHTLPDQSQNSVSVQPRRKRYDVDSIERRRRGNDVGLTSAQAGRGPPSRFRFNAVRDSSIASFTNINGGLVKPW